MHFRTRIAATAPRVPSLSAAVSLMAVSLSVFASGPIEYDWAGGCKAIPNDWVCDDCANANWSPSGQPGPLDTATITGAAVVARGCAKSVHVLEVVDGAFLTVRTDLAVGQLATVEGVAFGNGSTFSSTISTAGPFTMTGMSNAWSRGILTGTGSFLVSPGGVLTISPATTEKSLDGTTLENNGRVEAAAAFNVENDAAIENNDTWTMTDGNLGGSTPQNRAGIFENHGTLECIGPGNDLYTTIPVDSGGMIRSEARSLYIAAGGDHSGGGYEVAAGGTIVLTGFDVAGIPHGVHVTGDVEATGAGNLKFERETTFIEPTGSIDAMLETIEGDPGVVGLWIENCAVVQCDGELINRGAMRWSRGTFTGTTGVTNQTAGTLLIDEVGSGCGNARLETTLTNFGLTEQQTDLRLGHGGRIIAGGEYRLINGNVLDEGDDNLFRTILLLRRVGPSPAASVSIVVPYEQTISGNILAEQGKLLFHGGGTVAGGAWSIMPNGEVSIAAGTMTIGDLGDGATDGAGLVQVLGSGTFSITGASTEVDVEFGHVLEVDMAPNAADREFEFAEGTLRGAVRNRGDMNWRGGTITGLPGLRNLGCIDVPNSGSRTLSGPLANQASLNAGSFAIAGGQLTNTGEMLLLGGTISGSAGGKIFNRGVILKEGASVQTISADLTNAGGRVTVAAGTLVLSGVIDELVDGTLTGGRWEVASSATLSIPGTTITYLRHPAHVVLESGATFPAISSLVENAATVEVNGAGPVSFPFLQCNDGTISTLSGAIIETNGHIQNTALGVLSHRIRIFGPGDDGGFVMPTLSNEGTLRPGGAGETGSFPLTGALTQETTGVIEIDLAGTIPLDEYDRVQVDGDVVLGGTLHVNILPGYAPNGGEKFTVLTVTNGTLTGAFDGVTGAGAYDVSYSTNTVELTLVQPPVPGDVTGDGVVDFADLLDVLAAWGMCPNGDPCPADLNGDRVVNFAEVLIVLAAWS